MSRAMMLSLDRDTVVTKCDREDVGISAIEPLPEGGVRLVCMSNAGAETIRKKLKRHLISDDSRRENHRPRTPLW